MNLPWIRPHLIFISLPTALLYYLVPGLLSNRLTRFPGGCVMLSCLSVHPRHGPTSHPVESSLSEARSSCLFAKNNPLLATNSSGPEQGGEQQHHNTVKIPVGLILNIHFCDLTCLRMVVPLTLPAPIHLFYAWFHSHSSLSHTLMKMGEPISHRFDKRAHIMHPV